MDEKEQSVPAADPAEAHETPGGNPVSEPETQEVTTEVETPGGTTVTESPAE